MENRKKYTKSWRIMMYCLAVVCPPIPVFVIHGCSSDLAMSILLTLFFFLPGILHACITVWHVSSGGGESMRSERGLEWRMEQGWHGKTPKDDYRRDKRKTRKASTTREKYGEAIGSDQEYIERRSVTHPYYASSASSTSSSTQLNQTGSRKEANSSKSSSTVSLSLEKGDGLLPAAGSGLPPIGLDPILEFADDEEGRSQVAPTAPPNTISKPEKIVVSSRAFRKSLSDQVQSYSSEKFTPSHPRFGGQR